MPLYEVTLFQQYANQELINRWTYAADVNIITPPTAGLLLFLMGFIPDSNDVFPTDRVFSAMRAFQVSALTYRAVYARNLYNVNDFVEYVYSPAPAGLITTGEPMSPTVALGFRSNRTRQDIRRATKRFGGISELSVGPLGNVNISAPVVEAITSRMAQNLTALGPQTYRPVVLKKQPYVPDDSDRVAYRYFPTEAEQEANMGFISSWTMYSTIRTQVSRQYGRGR